MVEDLAEVWLSERSLHTSSPLLLNGLQDVLSKLSMNPCSLHRQKVWYCAVVWPRRGDF